MGEGLTTFLKDNLDKTWKAATLYLVRQVQEGES